LTPTKVPRKAKIRNIQPEIAKLWVPVKRTPTVQPRAIKDPHPSIIPPTSAVAELAMVIDSKPNLLLVTCPLF
jgi:hypothetical protein